MSILWMLVITCVVLQLSVFATTIFLHRTLTHRGLRLHPVVGNLMHLHIKLFTGIQPRQWVAVHRKHHHFSDKEGDPHSPHLEGLWTVLFGNAFMYRKEARNPATVNKYTPDYKEDWVDKIPFGAYGCFVGWALFILAFGWAWGSGLFVWQGITYILLNSAINSVCHMVGYKNFNNTATNVQWIAVITGGEGLHNNHHEHPSSARLSVLNKEFDPAWPLIWLMVRLGWADLNQASLAKAA